MKIELSQTSRERAESWLKSVTEPVARADQELFAQVRTSLLHAQYQVTMARATEILTKDQVTYAEVTESWVDRSVRDLARRALQWACKDLRNPLPKIRWFSLETPAESEYRKQDPDAWLTFKSEPIRGLAKQGEIWIRTDQRGRDLVETVAHEAKHLVTNAHACIDDEGEEREASLYGQFARGLVDIT